MTGIPATSATIASTISGDFTAFPLAQLRVADARARLAVVEIDSIGTALAGGFIGADEAVAWAHEAGVLGLIAGSSAVTSVSSSQRRAMQCHDSE